MEQTEVAIDDDKALGGQVLSPDPRVGQSLGRTAISGVAWLMAQNVGARLVGFGSQLILARLLAPTDFAELALAGTITALVGVLASFGVDDVLLQRLKTLRYWSTPAFWTSLGLGGLSMLLVFAAAPVAAAMYRTPALVPILMITALSMPLGALSTVPAVMIRAKLNFRFLAGYATAELVCTQILTIVLALRGFGVYSFILPWPAMALVKAVVYWTLTKPALGPLRLKQFRMMASSGSAVFGTRLITAAVSQGDYFVLGLLAPKPVLGAYFFAFRLAVQPVQMLAGNLSNVLFPALAQLRNDPDRQKAAALETSRVLAFAVMPYCFLQAAVAGPLLHLAFGDKWRLATPIAEILSVGLAFDAVSWIAGALLSARGEFRRAFIYSCIFSPCFFIAVTIGGLYGSAIGVASAVSIFYLIMPLLYSYCTFSSLGVSFWEVFVIYYSSSVLAAAAMGPAVWIARLAPYGDLARVAITTIVGCGLYAGLTRTLAPATYRQLVDRLAKVIRLRRGGM